MPSGISSIEFEWCRRQILWAGDTRRRLWLKLAKLLQSGVPILQALESMRERRIRLKSKSDPTAVALTVWCEQLKNGRRFAEAIQGWVPSQERMLLGAGDRAGNLPNALQSTSTIIVAQSKIRGSVIGGLAYPTILVFFSIGMLYLFGFKIIPAFSKIVPEDRWTGMAANMVVMSKFIQSWLWIIAGALVASIVAFIYSLDKWDGKWRVLADKLPPYNVYRMIVGSTWMIAFAALVEAGERVEDALDQMRKQASPWLRHRVEACLRGMRGGHNVGEALNRSGYGFPDPEIIDDIAVYSGLGGFNQALIMIGREWITESVEQIDAGMKVVFGIGIAVVTSLLAIMLSGLIAMQLQMGTVLQHGGLR